VAELPGQRRELSIYGPSVLAGGKLKKLKEFTDRRAFKVYLFFDSKSEQAHCIVLMADRSLSPIAPKRVRLARRDRSVIALQASPRCFFSGWGIWDQEGQSGTLPSMQEAFRANPARV
jgi:hypothetical protein